MPNRGAREGNQQAWGLPGRCPRQARAGGEGLCGDQTGMPYRFEGGKTGLRRGSKGALQAIRGT